MPRKRTYFLTLELDEDTYKKIYAFACLYFECDIEKALKRLIGDIISTAIMIHNLGCPGYRVQIICSDNLDMEKPFRPLICCKEVEPQEPTKMTAILSGSSPWDRT